MIITLLLFIISVFVAVLGGETLLNAKSAIHEIEAFMLFLIAAVLFVGATIVEAVNRVRAKLKDKEEGSDDITGEYQMIKILKEIEKNTKKF